MAAVSERIFKFPAKKLFERLEGRLVERKTRECLSITSKHKNLQFIKGYLGRVMGTQRRKSAKKNKSATNRQRLKKSQHLSAKRNRKLKKTKIRQK